MNQLQKVFNYNMHRVRTVVRDGEPWFFAKDVCDILEIGNPSQALSRLDEDERNTIISNEGIGNPQKTIVNEPGLYSLILGSRKSEAKQFKRWVTHEVIPSIRKHGAYATPQTIENIMNDPDFGIQLLTNLKEERDKRIKAEQRIEQQKPKVIFAEAYEVSNDLITVKEMANLLKQKGYETGEKRLYSWLRDNGYVCKKIGGMYNLPTQRALDLGILGISKGYRSGRDGEIKQTRTTKVTGKGQIYFVNKFISKEVG